MAATVVTVEMPEAVEGVVAGSVPSLVSDILVYPRHQCYVWLWLSARYCLPPPLQKNVKNIKTSDRIKILKTALKTC